jgi:tetratricopeptide (TPR) repeat protein
MEDSAMRTTLMAMLLVVGNLAVAAPARAGLYNSREMNRFFPVPATFSRFQDLWSDLRGLARDEKDVKNDWILNYHSRFRELQNADQSGDLSVDDRIELSACYLRIPNKDGSFRANDAIRVLEPAQAKEPRNFMVLANLAVAHQLAGNLERAISYEGLALESWPDAHPKLTLDQLHWYRRAEKFYYQLLMLRLREVEQPARGGEKSVDALFHPVDLVGSTGTYEAGKIAPRQWAELPGDAVPLVEQLLLWLPFDNRLYWLLGELLNAKGDVSAAFQAFNTLIGSDNQTSVKQPDQPRLLREHWRILREAANALPEVSVEDAPNPAAPPVSPSPSAANSGWFPDLRAVAVGFAAGVVITLLAGLQLREIRRRRELRAGHPPTGAG